MSCGDPHETDCAEVLAEVWLFLDHECDQTRRALLAHHLDECGPCLQQYGIDEKLKALLAAKCGGEHAPAGLKDRLRQQIRVAVLEQAEFVAGDGERRTATTTSSVTVESGPDGTSVELRSTRIERSD